MYTGGVKGPKGDKAVNQAEKQGKEVETYKKGKIAIKSSGAHEQTKSRSSKSGQIAW